MTAPLSPDEPDTVTTDREEDTVYDEAEEQQVAERLQALGYIE
jgi:hypothetical protein